MPDQLARLIREIDGTGSAVVISPHLDDAVLSCGALLGHLALCCPVTVVTAFTAAGPRPWSLPARRQLRAVGLDAEVLFQRRRAEDMSVLTGLGVNAIHLGLRDALFRRVDEVTDEPTWRGRRPAYPTFRFDAARGRVASSDAGLPAQIGSGISRALQGSEISVLFAPLGIGRHVDHLIARRATRYLACRTVYYSDFPYSETAAPDADFVQSAALAPYPWISGRAENAKRIAGYRTQFDGLFPHGTVPTRPEIYWIPAKDIATAA